MPPIRKYDYSAERRKEILDRKEFSKETENKYVEYLGCVAANKEGAKFV
jgi:hypothetical protein